MKIWSNHLNIRLEWKVYTRFVSLIVVLLVGCASNPAAEKEQALKLMDYKVEVYGPACEKLGYAANTDAWRECIQHEYDQTLARQQRQWDSLYWNPYRSPYRAPYRY